MKEKHKRWAILSAVAVVFLLIGMYVVPMVSFAVNPNASSKVLNEMYVEAGTSEDAGNFGTPEQWLDSCWNKCNTEFNHNAQQLSVCSEKCMNTAMALNQ